MFTRTLRTVLCGESLAQVRYLLSLSLSRAKTTKPLVQYSNYSSKPDEIKVTFVKHNGEIVVTSGKEGDSLLDVVVNKNLDFDGFGACEGTLTCSTCHVVLRKEDFDKLPQKPTDEELDMLDLAYDLTDTSRLGCQIILTKDLQGLTVNVPATVNDARNS